MLRPVLRGRDIGRYQANWAGLWLIDTHNGYGNVQPVNVDDYWAVKEHLGQFYPKLEKRQDQGVTPYNLRNCAYHAEFEKNEKLIWMHMAPMARFAYSNSRNTFCNQKAFIVTGNSLKYLCAVLNSHLVTWQVKNIAVTTGMGLIQWDKFVVEQLPVPKISTIDQKPFICLVDEILKAKALDAKADTSILESKIDRLVYLLYDLDKYEVDEISRLHSM